MEHLIVLFDVCAIGDVLVLVAAVAVVAAVVFPEDFAYITI